jgi:hypothetical protein
MAGATQEGRWAAAEQTGDWYLLYKAACTDRALAARWETLHRGWVNARPSGYGAGWGDGGVMLTTGWCSVLGGGAGGSGW